MWATGLERDHQQDNPSRRIYDRAGFTRCGTEGGSWTMGVELDGRASGP